jgi:hypothetical protein
LAVVDWLGYWLQLQLGEQQKLMPRMAEVLSQTIRYVDGPFQTLGPLKVHRGGYLEMNHAQVNEASKLSWMEGDMVQ